MDTTSGTDRDTRMADRFSAGISYLREHDRLATGLLVSPPYAFLLLFFALPLVAMLLISFRAGTVDGPWTLENYRQFLFTEVYRVILWRTFVITVKVTVIVVIVGYALAYSIVRFSRRTTLLLLLVILPFWTSYIIRMYAWINILQSDGVLDSTLSLVGLPPVGLLYSETAVLIGFTYVWLPLAILPFYASLANMDPDLIEAAKDLGAGPVKAFFTVTLPTTINGVVTGTILVFIPTFGSFLTPRLLGGTNNVMIGMIVENQFKTAFNWPFGAAIGMVLSAIVVALLIAAGKAGANLIGGEG
ncbi:ABC transporter permease [Halodesulfurarchaeum sp.]|uniref:ABC transporter permease n=1 Tax=Halodesulfurarchaeum sp. TaxID=1980530 RepID=UPI002FC30FA4